ncbi:major facilitator super transporter protein [Coemansia asiatica]|nr:major facilitator super transporter protein [Coemansia asiatica]
MSGKLQSVYGTRQYDRLVIMLVDALRNDFVFGNNSAMAYTQKLLRSGDALGYTAKALAPTVTMPRIKALMTGTVPNFLDAVLNIAESDTSSSLKFHDNLLWQLKNQGKTINMFGDDTWLRLFPDIFSKTDGTSSFFVTDTVEVDVNVTRHVRPGLEQSGWDVTIFHYLGLDHIGHLGGPDSPLMKPKQEEMDRVVQTVHEVVTRQDAQRQIEDPNAKPTLFVLLGDHAMNEIGNHGGNSQLETSTVFVFMGQGIRGQSIADEGKNALSALLTKEVPQINLVPTLALLFGVPIPKNNLGLPLADLIHGYPDEERLWLLQLAAHQMYGVVQANGGDVSAVDIDIDNVDVINASREKKLLGCDQEHGSVSESLRCEYMRALIAHRWFVDSKMANAAEAASKAEREYYEFMEHANAHLSQTFSGYDLSAMAIGIALFGIVVLLLFGLLQSYSSSGGGIVSSKSKKIRVSLPSILLLITYLISVQSSSLIEEEHQFWYHWTQTMFLLRLITSTTFSAGFRSFAQMCLFRIVRAWNQTGQKWTGEIDVRYHLNGSHKCLMWVLVIASFVFFGMCVGWVHKAAAMATESIYAVPRSRRSMLLHRYISSPDSGAAGKSKNRYQRRLAFGQRVLRGIQTTALTNALVYQMERNGGWETIGISRSVWMAVRWFTPTDLADIARFVYLLTLAAIGTGAVCVWLRCKVGKPKPAVASTLEGLVGILPLLTLLARPHNIPVFAIFMAMFILFFPQFMPGMHGLNRLAAAAQTAAQTGTEHLLQQQLQQQEHQFGRRYGGWQLPCLHPSKALVHLCLVHASFFALGNSNSLASLDISNAYAGVSRYNEGLVGALLFIGNWAGPLWWAAAGFVAFALTSRESGTGDRQLRQLVEWLVAAHLWQALTLLMLSIVVTTMRTHLFIWSVFSPRYLYQIAWFVAFYLLFGTIGSAAWLAWIIS